jgi:hypothetical protein
MCFAPSFCEVYGSYVELAYATAELKDLKKDGLSKEQQICWTNALMDNIPNSLATRLNAYARNEISLMESEHAAMIDELEPFLKSETVASPRLRSEEWIILSFILYVVTGTFWLPVVWMEMRMRDLALAAAAHDRPLSSAYHRLFWTWFLFGFPAFVAVAGIL